MSTDARKDVVACNQRLLTSIAMGDWVTYSELCDPTLTAFEPESKGQLIEGLAFHRFYFDLGGTRGPHHTTMAAPNVRMLGEDVAIVSYVRLVQKLDDAGVPVVAAAEETRVWHHTGGRWRHVHFHRSPLA
jgi:calcium/calmodulin dependent protein kinase II association protein